MKNKHFPEEKNKLLTILINFVSAPLPKTKIAGSMYRNTSRHCANNLIKIFTYIDFDSISDLF